MTGSPDTTASSTAGAEAPFRPVEAKLRKAVYQAIRVASYERAPTARGSYLHFVPPVRSASELADLSARVNWYLPGCKVEVYVQDGTTFRFGPDDADHMDPALVRDPGWAAAPPRGAPEYVFWRFTGREAAQFVMHARRAEVVDPALYVLAENGWQRLHKRYGRPVPALGTEPLRRLIADHGRADSALVLGTGPSASYVKPAEIDADVRILCNSAVRDLELITAMQPAAIAFADPVFHFSPNKYAAAFRRDLLRAAEVSGAYLVTHNHWASFLLAHHPEVAERLVILHPDYKQSWRAPSTSSTSTRLTGNVMTGLQLPIAWALAKTIQIGGCDGRSPDETYFWKHNPKIQYSSGLMAAAFTAHPAFFRDVDYGTYYTRHCADLEDLLRSIEASGRPVTSVTPSWMDALRRRAITDLPDPG